MEKVDLFLKLKGAIDSSKELVSEGGRNINGGADKYFETNLTKTACTHLVVYYSRIYVNNQDVSKQFTSAEIRLLYALVELKLERQQKQKKQDTLDLIAML